MIILLLISILVLLTFLVTLKLFKFHFILLRSFIFIISVFSIVFYIVLITLTNIEAEASLKSTRQLMEINKNNNVNKVVQKMYEDELLRVDRMNKDFWITGCFVRIEK